MSQIDLKNLSRENPSPAARPQGAEGRLRRRLIFGLAFCALLLLILEGAGYWVTFKQPAPVAEAAEKPRTAQQLQKENASLRKKIDALAPKGIYVVVDTAGNRVSLRKGDQILRSMLASCGSGNVLEDPVGGRTWTFDTPRGNFRINSKITKPVWIKPDWAFIEEGEPVPKNYSERAEPGMMGNYALGIGQGYFLHGTLYTRLLGRNVSHGCVRLGDEDLKFLVDSVGIGTQVFIF